MILECPDAWFPKSRNEETFKDRLKENEEALLVSKNVFRVDGHEKL